MTASGGKAETPFGNGRETAALLERVNALERGMSGLEADVKNAGKTDWKTFAAFVGIGLTFATLLGGVFAGFRMMDVARIDKIEAFTSENIVTRAEHAAIAEREAALRQAIVERVAQIRLELEAIKSQNLATYNVRDVIVKMQEEIDRLQSLRVRGETP